jgi:chromosome segregation ATPase
MEIINQELKKMTTQIETLKEENGDLVDELDQKEDEYKELMEENKALTKKLAQSRSQVDIQSSNLSQTANGLRGKISYLEKQNQELTKQVSQEKKNHIIALKNKIALLEDELAKRPKKVEQVEQRTQTGS